MNRDAVVHYRLKVHGAVNFILEAAFSEVRLMKKTTRAVMHVLMKLTRIFVFFDSHSRAVFRSRGLPTDIARRIFLLSTFLRCFAPNSIIGTVDWLCVGF